MLYFNDVSSKLLKLGAFITDTGIRMIWFDHVAADFTLRRVLAVSTRSAITTPKVNRFFNKIWSSLGTLSKAGLGIFWVPSAP